MKKKRIAARMSCHLFMDRLREPKDINQIPDLCDGSAYFWLEEYLAIKGYIQTSRLEINIQNRFYSTHGS